jgi:formate hydrogenlyase subunit 3/multisubunit Na+/H+ antiporter MnhD subunit
MKILGREPVVITTLLATLLQLLNAFVLHWTDDRTAAINAAIAVILAALATALTSVDRALPLLSGVAQALLTVGATFGFHLSADKTTALMAVIAAFLAFRGVRPQVTPVIAADGTRNPKRAMYRRAA